MIAVIHIHALDKTLLGGRLAPKTICFDINAGVVAGLIGASGSGKPTLLRDMAVLVAGDKARAGQVQIHG